MTVIYDAPNPKPRADFSVTYSGNLADCVKLYEFVVDGDVLQASIDGRTGEAATIRVSGVPDPTGPSRR